MGANQRKSFCLTSMMSTLHLTNRDLKRLIRYQHPSNVIFKCRKSNRSRPISLEPEVIKVGVGPPQGCRSTFRGGSVNGSGKIWDGLLEIFWQLSSNILQYILHLLYGYPRGRQGNGTMSYFNNIHVVSYDKCPHLRSLTLWLTRRDELNSGCDLW